MPSSASDAATTASLSQVDAASGCSTKDTNSSPCSWIAHMMEAQNKWKGVSVSLEYLQEPKEEFKVTTCNWEREGNSVFSEFGQVLQHDQSSNSRASVEADEESGGGGSGGDHINNNSFYNSHGDLVANLKSPASACSQTHAAGNRSIINGDHHHLLMTENLAVSYH